MGLYIKHQKYQHCIVRFIVLLTKFKFFKVSQNIYRRNILIRHEIIYFEALYSYETRHISGWVKLNI